MQAARTTVAKHCLKGLPVLILTLLSACAGTQNRHTDPVGDPWEGYNRKMHAFNMGLDKVVRPIAVGYDRVTPDPLQRGIGNFFRNLAYPVTVSNQVLQGKFVAGIESTARFLVNSTLGLLGFFDVASRAGLPQHDEDFAQTLATWGWEQSRYFVLPILGPSSLRDALGRSFYGYLHPVSWYAREEHVYWPMALDLLQLRASLLEQDQAIFESYDPYVFLRDAYLQHREFLIHDGDPPTPDYDIYLDDVED